eukprot:scaffold8085_cov127-Isochrysis_galbana.AAC.2
MADGAMVTKARPPLNSPTPTCTLYKTHSFWASGEDNSFWDDLYIKIKSAIAAWRAPNSKTGSAQHNGTAARQKCGIASCGAFSMARAGPGAVGYG